MSKIKFVSLTSLGLGGIWGHDVKPRANYSVKIIGCNRAHERQTLSALVVFKVQNIQASYPNYNKIQKHFQNVMLVGMASEISKNYTYKCVDRSRHNGIKGAKAKCAH